MDGPILESFEAFRCRVARSRRGAGPTCYHLLAYNQSKRARGADSGGLRQRGGDSEGGSVSSIGGRSLGLLEGILAANKLGVPGGAKGDRRDARRRVGGSRKAAYPMAGLAL